MMKNILKLLRRIREVSEMIRLLVLAVCFAVVLALVASVSSSEQDSRKITTYEVPTSGKIIDVTYVTEFDEWWVKCLERDGVSIYSYDNRSKKWGQVRFVPAPRASQEKLDQSVTSQQQDGASPTGDSDTKLSDKKVGADRSASPQKNASEQKKVGEEKKRSAEKRKWWDPLNLLKKAD
jgi:hypothetical protein